MRTVALFSLILVLFSACKEDPCDNVTCLNGGTCVDGLGTCECLPGFEGDSCEINTFQLFLGSFEAEYGGCVDTSPDHRVGIEQEGGEEKLRITGLGDYACPSGTLAISANVNGNALIINRQDVDCGAIVYTYEGNGGIQGDTLRLTFSVEYDTGGSTRKDACSATLVKE